VYEVSNLRARDRADRLRTEAGNCVNIAVRETTEAFAAQLIDEAARLMKRSAELSKKAAATDDTSA
jgi:hypothetical protein